MKANLLWNHLVYKFKQLPIMTCTINGDLSTPINEQRQANGLVIHLILSIKLI